MKDNIVQFAEVRRRVARDVTGGSDSLKERIAKTKRLQKGDKPSFACNLGVLAARLSPQDPLEGVRRIIAQSGQRGVWEKRRRYFRLPDEDASDPNSEGAYASNPQAFLRLAEAAGALLCASRDAAILERERERAIKVLATGTSFLPTFVPSSSADQSAKELLDEYASVLSEAVKSRTQLTKLWKVLETTPLDVEVLSADEVAAADPLPEAAIVPGEVFSLAEGEVAVLSPAKNPLASETKWSQPSIFIGHVAVSQSLRAFCIPPQRKPLFSSTPGYHETLSDEDRQWMISVGFDFENSKFPGYDFNYERIGWKEICVSILFPVYIGIFKDYYGNPEPRVSFYGGAFERVGAFERENIYELLKNESRISKSNLTLAQTKYVHCADGTSHDINIFYQKPFDPEFAPDSPAIAILPGQWDIGPDETEWQSRDVWIEGGPEELWSIDEAEDWTDSELVYELLMGEKARFYPALPQSDQVGGVLPEGSIAASLLYNAQHASRENRITQMLIDKAGQRADAGLKYYEALLDEARSAIHRI